MDSPDLYDDLSGLGDDEDAASDTDTDNTERTETTERESVHSMNHHIDMERDDRSSSSGSSSSSSGDGRSVIEVDESVLQEMAAMGVRAQPQAQGEADYDCDDGTSA